jgi:peptidoglycan/xylan/chitin deacetylase (PgdA/CDA1 family)
MKSIPVPFFIRAMFALFCLCLPFSGQAAAPAPIRFLLTFDDGPSASLYMNSTEQVLDTLARNDSQSGIKAIFFAQTRAPNGGGSAPGRQLLRREIEEGHLLAFHTATANHDNHRKLEPALFEQSLQFGVADLTAVTGMPPTLVRPPFWNYDARTLAAYRQHGMQMLLTDLSANDGKIWGWNLSWHKHANFLAQLTTLRERWRANALPEVDGSTPVVVTFHDVNTYTARTLAVYLEILLQVARELDMPTAARPFYDDRQALERAALARTVQEGDPQPALPGFWNWLWR